MKKIEEHACFDGVQMVYEHESFATECTMRFGLYLPPMAQQKPVPVLYWLSGLTCTAQNFITKAGAQRVAAELGLAIVVPDTSPRGTHIPGDDKHYELGQGAGFYVDATQEPWSKNYQMATYITKELPELLDKNAPINARACGIFGHSMGGHGALTLALKNPQQYRSLSAFSPICALMQTPWGQKALASYLGDDKAAWHEYDACELVESRGWMHQDILIDQGAKDSFLAEQLKPELFKQACEKARVGLSLRMQKSYDHSYYFIASFIEDHLRFHASNLKGL